jgi:hypothetical protein
LVSGRFFKTRNYWLNHGKALDLKLTAGLFEIKRPRKRKEVKNRALQARRDYDRTTRE